MATVVRNLNFFLSPNGSDNRFGLQQGIFKWSLTMPFMLKNPGNYFQIGINSFTAPAGFFVDFITDQQVYVHGGGGTSDTLYIAAGSYSVQSIINSLNVQANAIHPLNQPFFEISASGRMVSKYTTLVSDTLEFDFSPILAYLLGLINNPYYSGTYSITIPVNVPLISNYFPQSAVNKSLYILYTSGSVNDSHNLSILSLSNAFPEFTSDERRCICTVPLTSAFLDPISYEAHNLSFSALSTQNFDNITLEFATNTFPSFVPINYNFTIHVVIQECIPAEEVYQTIGVGDSINPIGAALPVEPTPIKVITADEQNKEDENKIVELARKLKQKRKRDAKVDEPQTQDQPATAPTPSI